MSKNLSDVGVMNTEKCNTGNWLGAKPHYYLSASESFFDEEPKKTKSAHLRGVSSASRGHTRSIMIARLRAATGIEMIGHVLINLHV